MKGKKLSSKELQEYLWEALQDFKAGNITTKEIQALTNTAGKIVQIALLDIMTKNSIGNNNEKALPDIGKK